jgi:hypothetical protein
MGSGQQLTTVVNPYTRDVYCVWSLVPRWVSLGNSTRTNVCFAEALGQLHYAITWKLKRRTLSGVLCDAAAAKERRIGYVPRNSTMPLLWANLAKFEVTDL